VYRKYKLNFSNKKLIQVCGVEISSKEVYESGLVQLILELY
jgi:hypothetical protein